MNGRLLRREVAGDVQNQLRDTGRKGLGRAVDIRHDSHVRGHRAVDCVQRRDLRLLFGIRPEREIAEPAYRHYRRIEYIGFADAFLPATPLKLSLEWGQPASQYAVKEMCS